jgi:hypothetical protein
MESERGNHQRGYGAEGIRCQPRLHHQRHPSRRLEYREGAIWGNPYLRILRSQIEQYIVAELGSDYLTSRKRKAELNTIKKEMAELRKRLNELQTRRTELEKQMESS